MKAINTYYNGHVFRSRLEARWAVAFDHAGYKWDYEPEGFELDGVGRYLPDFLVNIPSWLDGGFNYWAEVKPTKPTALELEKAHALVVATKQPLILLIGHPAGVLYWEITPKWEMLSGCDSYFKSCVESGTEVVRLRTGQVTTASRFNIFPSCGSGIPAECYLTPSDHFPMPCEVPYPEINFAPIDAANSARFEFGHSGSALHLAA